jgi:hypothetical protein
MERQHNVTFEKSATERQVLIEIGTVPQAADARNLSGAP